MPSIDPSENCGPTELRYRFRVDPNRNPELAQFLLAQMGDRANNEFIVFLLNAGMHAIRSGTPVAAPQIPSPTPLVISPPRTSSKTTHKRSPSSTPPPSSHPHATPPSVSTAATALTTHVIDAHEPHAHVTPGHPVPAQATVAPAAPSQATPDHPWPVHAPFPAAAPASALPPHPSPAAGTSISAWSTPTSSVPATTQDAEVVHPTTSPSPPPPLTSPPVATYTPTHHESTTDYDTGGSSLLGRFINL